MRRMRRLFLIAWLAGAVGLAGCRSGRSGGGTSVSVTDASSDTSASEAARTPFPVLLFSRTAGFRHDSIPAAIQALTELQDSGGFVVEATEDPTQFTADNLARFRVVVFLLTTGDVLDDDQQAAFEAWIAAGGGYLGVHSAADTEYAWPFYGALVGAYFKAHPAVQAASVDVAAADHPAMAGLTSPWMRTDEWYDFQTNPRDAVTVLATVDEVSYTGGTMGPDHPIVWVHATSGGGRALYTAMGHTQQSYADPAFRQHLTGALRWVAGVE
jgi:type 1 glutamine amidotransferase